MPKFLDRPKWNDNGTYRSAARITLNGSVNQNPDFYAPTTQGTDGYVLMGGQSTPQWVDIGLKQVESITKSVGNYASSSNYYSNTWSSTATSTGAQSLSAWFLQKSGNSVILQSNDQSTYYTTTYTFNKSYIKIANADLDSNFLQYGDWTYMFSSSLRRELTQQHVPPTSLTASLHITATTNNSVTFRGGKIIMNYSSSSLATNLYNFLKTYESGQSSTSGFFPYFALSSNAWSI